MYIELTITAVADRDPSCNLLTFTERHTFRVTDPPNEKKIRDLCEQHKERFLDVWPHPRNSKPSLIPLDVTYKMFEGRMP